MKRFLAFLSVMLVLAPLVQADVRQPSATVLVALFEEDGTPAQAIDLNIYNVDHQTFQTVKVMESPYKLELIPGRYRIYSAQAIPMGDHVARYSSPEAKLHLENRAYESLVLRLRKGDDPMTLLSHSTLSKVGLSDDLVSSSN